jgi:melibiose permease/lactose/raffinose/galactose permease
MDRKVSRDHTQFCRNLILPLISILLGYIVYMKKFRIDEEVYAKIIGMLRARGDIEHER